MFILFSNIIKSGLKNTITRLNNIITSSTIDLTRDITNSFI